MNHYKIIESLTDKILKYRVREATPKESDEAKNRFDRIEQFVATDQRDVPVTPLLSNALQKEFKSDKFRLELSAPATLAEKEIISAMVEIGLRHHGDPVYDYSSVDEKRFADVDFGRNLSRMGREVTPGSWQRRLDTVSKYKDAANKPFKPDKREFEAAIDTVIAEYGQNKVDHLQTGPRGRVPFQSYHTNVGYPYGANDRTVYNGKKFEEIAGEESKKLDPSHIPNLPAGLAGRDQRAKLPIDIKSVSDVAGISEFSPSKARVVYMTSRIGNIHIAKIKLPLIEYVKTHIGMFSGYNDDVTLSQIMFDMYQKANDLNYKLMNLDFASFDTTISASLLASACHIQQQGCATNQGKLLTGLGTLGNAKMPLKYNDGDEHHTMFKVGAISSGYIGTNLDGGTVNALIITYALNKVLGTVEVNRRIRKFRQANLPGILVMGDDVLISILDSYQQAFELKQHITDAFGMEVHPDKGEGGCFFLQKRIDHNTRRGEGLTPTPRSVSKCFGVERPKGLGPYAWTMASGMKLMNSRYTPELDDVISLVASYDKMKLGMFTKDGEANNLASFREALSSESEEHGLTTEQRLSDGDPNEAYVWSSGAPSSSGLTETGRLISKGVRDGNPGKLNYAISVDAVPQHKLDLDFTPVESDE